jgi:RpiR family carbohydrate utilization transcriptional regulator
MELKDEKTVIETIKEKYNEIFLAETKVADFILNNPEEAVNANVSELANLSGVSDATVIRFCKHIGYQGYYQLRVNLYRDLGKKQGEQDNLQETEGNSVCGIFQNFASTLAGIGKSISQESMLECVNIINRCNYVHIVAVGNTSPLAQYMGFRLGRLGIRCTYNMIPEFFLNYINLAQKDDIVFAISQSGTSKHVVQAMELAKERNLKIIAVTAYEYSPVSRLADYLLLSGAQEQQFDYYKTYSHLNETAVIDALLHFLTNKQKITSSNADKPEIMLSEFKL